MSVPSNGFYFPAAQTHMPDFASSGNSGGSAVPAREPENKPYTSQLRISNLRKFDKFLRKHRGRKGGTFTCSSRSTYSINNDINEMLEEEDSDECGGGAGDDNGIEEDEVASQCCLDIEEEDQMVGGEITDQLLLMHDPPGLKSHHHHHRDQYLEAMPMMCDGLAADEDPPTFCYPHSPLQDDEGYFG